MVCAAVADVAERSDRPAGVGAVQTVVYLAAPQEDDAKAKNHPELLAGSLLDVARIVRSVTNGRFNESPPAVYVVGRGIERVANTDMADPELAPIPVLLRSAVAEMPGLRVRFIDLDPRDLAAGADDIVGELGYATNDIEVAYRDGVRWVKGLQRLPDDATLAAQIPSGAVHLISGDWVGWPTSWRGC